MITAAVSALLGIFGGIVPDILKEWKETREFAREKEMLNLQSQLQLKKLDAELAGRRAEFDMQTVIEELKAHAVQMAEIYKSAQPIGIRWIDGFNAFQRPFAINLITLMFVATASLFSVGVYLEFRAGHIDMMTAAEVVWASMVGEAIQAVLGYLFGYRSAAKIRGRDR